MLTWCEIWVLHAIIGPGILTGATGWKVSGNPISRACEHTNRFSVFEKFNRTRVTFSNIVIIGSTTRRTIRDVFQKISTCVEVCHTACTYGRLQFAPTWVRNSMNHIHVGTQSLTALERGTTNKYGKARPPHQQSRRRTTGRELSEMNHRMHSPIV